MLKKENDVFIIQVIKLYFSEQSSAKYTAIFAISTEGLLGYEVYEKGGIAARRGIVIG